MIYGNQHSWQNSENVQQILVFLNQEKKDQFDRDFSTVVNQYGIEDASENSLGAEYKLRAVLESNGRWAAIIRDGFQGKLLVESYLTFDSAEKALEACKQFSSDLQLCQLQKKIKNMHRLNNPWMVY